MLSEDNNEREEHTMNFEDQFSEGKYGESDSSQVNEQ